MARYKKADSEWKEIANLKQAYNTNKSNAKYRRVEFLFTFEEWIKIWLDSGHWNERGDRKGQYCMARFGDQGPYAVNNVRIVTVEENRKENKKPDIFLGKLSSSRIGIKLGPLSEATKRNISHALFGIVRSDETKQKISKTLSGRKLSAETRARMSISKKAMHQRKRELLNGKGSKKIPISTAGRIDSQS